MNRKLEKTAFIWKRNPKHLNNSVHLCWAYQLGRPKYPQLLHLCAHLKPPLPPMDHKQNTYSVCEDSSVSNIKFPYNHTICNKACNNVYGHNTPLWHRENYLCLLDQSDYRISPSPDMYAQESWIRDSVRKKSWAFPFLMLLTSPLLWGVFCGHGTLLTGSSWVTQAKHPEKQTILLKI